jgi:4-amino-4-deoxy-L-arabinose transferase-like glycosyltransferase
MSQPAPRSGLPWRVLELALFVRVAAAGAVEWYVRRKGSGSVRICLFPDAEYYWSLARTIRAGTLYEVVEWGDIPHFALRTPGYPAFLAASQAVLGDRPLGVRLAQAVLGTLSVWLVYRLSRACEASGRRDQMSAGGNHASVRAIRRTWSIPVTAAALTAVHPYFLLMSAVILSEALFVPFMLLALWGQAVLWNGSESEPPRSRSVPREALIALGVGAASGAAILTRPSWALFVPVMLAAWAWRTLRAPDRTPRLRIVRTTGVVALSLAGLVLVMGPWWVRNARVFGRFVPTAVWMGASLYDGLNPRATGASDMSFLSEPDVWPLDELDQDRVLLSRALDFLSKHPRRTFELAVIKLGRYWSPWPSAESFRSPVLAAGGTLFAIPLLFLIGLGLWCRRGDLRTWVLLAGPLFYFCVLHLFFASSMRYRIPAEVPAMSLAAAGLLAAARRVGFVGAGDGGEGM